MMLAAILLCSFAAICVGVGDELGKSYADHLRSSLESGNDEEPITIILRAKHRPIHSSSFVKVLIEIVNSARPESLRGQAASVVGLMCPQSESALISKALISLVQNDRSSQVREGAAISLGNLDLDTDELVAALLVAAKDSDPNVRGECYRSLGSKRQRQDEILESLGNAISDCGKEKYALSDSFFSERPVCIAAIEALGKHSESAAGALPGLMEYTQNENLDIALASCVAISKINNDPRVHSQIERQLWCHLELDSESSGLAILRCISALDCLTGLQVPPEIAIRKVSISKIRKLLKNRDILLLYEPLLDAVAFCLRGFGESARDCLPELTSLASICSDGDQKVRLQQAITTIGGSLTKDNE